MIHASDPAPQSAEHGQALSTRPASLWAMSFHDASQLSKPRITLMVLITTFIGFVMADRSVHSAVSIANTLRYNWELLAITLIGTALSCMGASALNQVYERDTDALMRRTRLRPLPAGRVSLPAATALGLFMSITGVAILWLLVNGLTAMISAFTIFSYALMYTPLKRVSSVSTIVGAVPGALPPVMGFTAVANYVGIEAALLFGVLFLWQLPHFLAIAWLYRDEYGRAGMPMLPVLDPQGASTFRHILISCMALIPLGMLPTIFHVCGKVCFIGNTLAGVAFLIFGIELVRHKTRAHARAMFLASLVYLPVVLGLMMMDQL